MTVEFFLNQFFLLLTD